MSAKPMIALSGVRISWLTRARKSVLWALAVSAARKNGKSGLIAAWLLARVASPLARRDWRCVITSMTGALAKELRDAIESTALVSGLEEELTVYRSPQPGRIQGRHGTRIDFLAADKATGHAIGADLAIIDEAGLMQERQRGLWNALYSSISGRDGKFWCISIRGDGPMFAEMRERAGSKGLHWQEWVAPEGCALDDEDAWDAANPGIRDGIKARRYMRRASERAMSAPGNEAHFRAYDLNQPIDPERETIVTVREYAKCVQPNAPSIDGDVVVGIDLGGSTSMTCAVALSVDNGTMYVRGAFGDDPPLSVRARNDRLGTLYDRMQRDGELKLYPGRVTPVIPFLQEFFLEVGSMARVIQIGCDRHRRAEAVTAFREAGIPGYRVAWRGQGASATADGSHDVRAFQRLVRTCRLKTRGSVMLESAIASSMLRYDSAGNPALDKAHSAARIDALSAAVIAAGLAEMASPAPLLKVTVV